IGILQHYPGAAGRENRHLPRACLCKRSTSVYAPFKSAAFVRSSPYRRDGLLDGKLGRRDVNRQSSVGKTKASYQAVSRWRRTWKADICKSTAILFTRRIESVFRSPGSMAYKRAGRCYVGRTMETRTIRCGLRVCWSG